MDNELNIDDLPVVNAEIPMPVAAKVIRKRSTVALDPALTSVATAITELSKDGELGTEDMAVIEQLVEVQTRKIVHATDVTEAAHVEDVNGTVHIHW